MCNVFTCEADARRNRGARRCDWRGWREVLDHQCGTDCCEFVCNLGYVLVENGILHVWLLTGAK